MKPLLTIEEISILLNVKQTWIRSQVFQRKIPFKKLGRHIRFDIDEINEWVRLQKIK